MGIDLAPETQYQFIDRIERYLFKCVFKDGEPASRIPVKIKLRFRRKNGNESTVILNVTMSIRDGAGKAHLLKVFFRSWRRSDPPDKWGKWLEGDEECLREWLRSLKENA